MFGSRKALSEGAGKNGLVESKTANPKNEVLMSRRGFLGKVGATLGAVLGANVLASCEFAVHIEAKENPNFLSYENFARLVMQARQKYPKLLPPDASCGAQNKCSESNSESLECFMKILQADCDSHFNKEPKSKILWAVGIKALIGAFELNKMPPRPERTEENIAFNYNGDFFTIDTWYQSYLMTLYRLGLIEQKLEFSPANLITQTELNKLLEKILSL
jgi:hypothetical protein